MSSASQEAEGTRSSPMLAALLDAEAKHERTLAAARAGADRIVGEAREEVRRADERLVREIDELRRGIRERLESARSVELAALTEQGDARAAAFARLTSERADALAEDVVRGLLKGGAP
jgi:vacuolar-type H+-ATPase subunit E/Vma4